MKPDFGFHYPGQYWGNPDWIKNLVLFFDGIAKLIPEYMADHGSFDDYPIVSALKEHGLFNIVRPRNCGRRKGDTSAIQLAYRHHVFGWLGPFDPNDILRQSGIKFWFPVHVEIGILWE